MVEHVPAPGVLGALGLAEDLVVPGIPRPRRGLADRNLRGAPLAGSARGAGVEANLVLVDAETLRVDGRMCLRWTLPSCSWRAS